MNFNDLIRFVIFETTRFIAPEMVAVQWVITFVAALIIAIAPFHSSRRLLWLRDAFAKIANHKRLAITICAILPVAIRLSMLGFIPVPDPSIHDEFSHLLLADTLAHGHLTNPAHPMWRHFESIHIIQQPTYNSMYPPGPASAIALGQVLFREPWAGVVIGVALSFAAICWMLQAWMPAAWALFGTLVAILEFGIVSFWMDSYMGGAVAALGGALVIGALPRLKVKHPKTIHALLLGCGLVVLMNSRPFEGAILSITALAYLVWSLWGRIGPSHRIQALSKLLLPAALVLICGIGFTGYYSWRVTGSPIRMPYMVNRDTYGWPENLGFLPPKKVVFRHRVLHDMYLKEVGRREIYGDPIKLINDLTTRLFDNWTFFIGPLLTAPLLFIPWMFRSRRSRPLIVFVSVVLMLNLFQLVLYPYHLAPEVPIIFAIVVLGIRYIYVRLKRTSRIRAAYLVFTIPICLVLTGALKQQAEELNIPVAYWVRGYESHRDSRARIEAWLKARPGQQLVIVRYGPDHSPDQEWVYNHADIDGSKVVWAREMDPVANARLLHYFAHRKAWLLEADVYPQRVVPYRPAQVKKSRRGWALRPLKAQ